MNLRLCVVSAILVCLAATSAAAETPSVVMFEKPTAGNIKTIAVVTPAMSDQPTVYGLGWLQVGSGSLVGMAIKDTRVKELWQTIDGDRHPPKTLFVNAVVSALQADGYTVETVDAKRPDSEFLAAYPTEVKADAYLDVTFSEEADGYGYITPGQEWSDPFKAFAYASFRLIRASDHAVLAQNTVLYTPYFKQDTENSIAIQPNSAYTFKDFAAVKADPKTAAEGVQFALGQIAETIGAILN